MKFVVDAHLPRRSCGVLASHGHEAVHTLDLPAGNATSDEAINRISLDDRRVVISKDTDTPTVLTCALVGEPTRARTFFERCVPQTCDEYDYRPCLKYSAVPLHLDLETA